jgi:hypothetical protein
MAVSNGGVRRKRPSVIQFGGERDDEMDLYSRPKPDMAVKRVASTTYRSLKALNARKGIKTPQPRPRPAPAPASLKALNARKGIKTNSI